MQEQSLWRGFFFWFFNSVLASENIPMARLWRGYHYILRQEGDAPKPKKKNLKIDTQNKNQKSMEAVIGPELDNIDKSLDFLFSI